MEDKSFYLYYMTRATTPSLVARTTDHSNNQPKQAAQNIYIGKQQPLIRVKISKLMLIRGNAAMCAAIHWLEALGTLENSTSTGNP